jgi:hypothetical protein
MEQNVLFFLTIFFGGVVWRTVWQKTLRCDSRDKLFDIRDRLRVRFLDYGLTLDDKAYITFRKVINGYLKRMDILTLESFWAFWKATKNNPVGYEMIKLAVASDNEDMKTQIDELNGEIIILKRKAALVLLRHMLLRNIISALLIVAPIVGFIRIRNIITKLFFVVPVMSFLRITEFFNKLQYSIDGFAVLQPVEA